MEPSEHRGRPELKEHLQPERQEHRELQERREPMEPLARLEQQEHLGQQEHLALLEHRRMLLEQMRPEWKAWKEQKQLVLQELRERPER